MRRRKGEKAVSEIDSGKPKDINGIEINIGDTVYYARKASHSAKGELIQCEVTGFSNPAYDFKETEVRLGKYSATQPSKQIAVRIPVRKYGK